MSSPPSWSIEASARRLGHYAWAETRLFEVLGNLAAAGSAAAGSGHAWPVHAGPDLARFRLACLAHARHHAWHADLWRQRLPLVPGLGADVVVVAPNAEVVALFDELDRAAAEPTEDAESTEGAGPLVAAVGVFRVILPWLADTHQAHLASARRVSDGPVLRALELVVADHAQHRRQGAALLGSLTWSSREDLARPGALQTGMEARWAAGAPWQGWAT